MVSWILAALAANRAKVGAGLLGVYLYLVLNPGIYANHPRVALGLALLGAFLTGAGWLKSDSYYRDRKEPAGWLKSDSYYRDRKEP